MRQRVIPVRMGRRAPERDDPVGTDSPRPSPLSPGTIDAASHVFICIETAYRFSSRHVFASGFINVLLENHSSCPHIPMGMS